MSRIWKKPINIPSWVEVKIDWNSIIVKWPKGQLIQKLLEQVKIDIIDNQIKVSVISDEYKNLWWLYRTLINNMINWVTNWYEKKLLVIWVWYWAKLQWKKLILNLGFSHPVEYNIPEWVQISVEKDVKWNDVITIKGIDKQLVWQVAAQIRDLKRPEPYKWKWIRYIDEVVKQKVWKQSKK